MGGVGEQFPTQLVDIIALTSFARVAAGSSAITSIAVASTGTAYSASFPLPRNCTFSWDVQFSSSGVVAVTVELEQGFARETTLQSADTVHFCIPDNKTSTSRMYPTIGDTNLHNVAYAPNATPVGRLKFTGTGSNDASTVCSLAHMLTVKNNP